MMRTNHQIELAMQVGINWTWFLAYSVADDYVVRHAETKLRRGSSLCDLLEAKASGVYRLEEIKADAGLPRIAHGITIDEVYRPFRAVEPYYVDRPFDWESLI